jgi:ATPase family associated with various cellular activities (AAA)
MRFAQIKSLVGATFNAGNSHEVFAIEGSPGCGKSALAREVAEDIGANFIDLNFSLLDTPDVAGLFYPDGADQQLKAYANPNIAALSSGKWVVNIDEFNDAPMHMQNLARRLFWTREMNGVKIGDEVYFILTANRAKDKSGASRMSGKVVNAVTRLEMESNLEDFTTYMLATNNPNHLVTSFLRNMPQALDEYNPDHHASPTPRQWELVSKIPMSLPDDLYMKSVIGKVGEGRGTAFMAYKTMFDAMVSIDEVILRPDDTPVPERLDAQYAIAGAASAHANPGNLDRLCRYIKRLNRDFYTQFWNDILLKAKNAKDPEVANATRELMRTKEFQIFATEQGSTLSAGV